MTEQKRVLVVDDDERWRARAYAMATSCGLTVTEAKNSKEAMDLLDSESFDLLITDNWMEYADAGIDLLMRNWYLKQEIPSILHTSDLMKRQAERLAKELPDIIFVKKSAHGDNPALISAIKKLLPE